MNNFPNKFIIIIDNLENYMNIHEECLLKYLKYPDGLSYSTELLKLNNHIMEKQFLLKNFGLDNVRLEIKI